jgi:hypothetical protein
LALLDNPLSTWSTIPQKGLYLLTGSSTKESDEEMHTGARRIALGATPERLLGPEIEFTGFLFESPAIHDLRVDAQPHRAEVRFYRDNKGWRWMQSWNPGTGMIFHGPGGGPSERPPSGVVDELVVDITI